MGLFRRFLASIPVAEIMIVVGIIVAAKLLYVFSVGFSHRAVELQLEQKKRAEDQMIREQFVCEIADDQLEKSSPQSFQSPGMLQ
jgi:hypothetical protein